MAWENLPMPWLRRRQHASHSRAASFPQRKEDMWIQSSSDIGRELAGLQGLLEDTYVVSVQALGGASLGWLRGLSVISAASTAASTVVLEQAEVLVTRPTGSGWWVISAPIIRV